MKCIRSFVLIHRQKTLQVPVDSDWADDRETRQSCSGGAVLFHVGAHAEDESFFSSVEAELYGIGSGAIEGLGAAQLLKEWQYKTVPLLQTDSQSAHEEWLKTGRLRICKVSTHDNPADLTTKAMNREKLIKFG